MPFAPESQNAAKDIHKVSLPSQYSVKGSNIILFFPQKESRGSLKLFFKGIFFKISDF